MRRRQRYIAWLSVSAAMLCTVPALAADRAEELASGLTDSIEQLLRQRVPAAALQEADLDPAFISALGDLPAVQAASTVDFDRDIRPIFEANCFKCHGADKAKGGLRLHAREAAMAGGDSGAAFVPGDSGRSRLVKFVVGTDKDNVMPPTGPRLSGSEIALIRRWIDEGAVWPEDVVTASVRSTHWAYQKPVRPEPPKVGSTDWPRNQIDHFILSRLESEGLSPAPEVDKARLLRRVTLDLTGLPPTVEELDAFLADTSDDAYDKVIDRLFASPHYGERMARPWLDLARYADSNGYHIDTDRVIWKYRDWVINAFNQNMPFDQFTIEQLAGDMLPDATIEQRIATGFHRNTLFNEEGGIDQEEFRTKAVIDRVNTTMEVWLGQTFACAQCHTHKYDPFTQREYYEFYAIFNNTPDLGGGTFASRAPLLEFPTDEQREQLDSVRAKIKTAEATLDANQERFVALQREWEQRVTVGAPEWRILPPQFAASRQGVLLDELADGSLVATGDPADKDTYTVSMYSDAPTITGFRLDAMVDERLPNQGPGRQQSGNFVLTEFIVHAAPLSDPSAMSAVALRNATADYSQGGYDISAAIDGKPNTGWAIASRMGAPHHAVFETTEPINAAGGLVLTFTLAQEHGDGHTLGRFRISLTGSPQPLFATQPEDEVAELIALAPDERSKEQADQLAEHYRKISPHIRPIDHELRALRDQESNLQKQVLTTMVMKELDEPRETFLHVRGDFLNPGDRVYAAVPAVFATASAPSSPNRLTLARWLVDDDNPLTARVTINRLWQMVFGTGIVKTSEDFGTRGEAPSHPELLDWLATEFVQRDWDIQAMLRLMVTSATYRQSARVTPDLLEHDPYNRLYARGPRFRMEAEMIRDMSMAVSGLFNPKIGGPSVYPFQPPGLWEEKSLDKYRSQQWETNTDGDQYRRGLYTYLRRSVPYPMMTTFDAPSREFCTARRPRTNTPLQAMVTLNDPVFVECARAFAQRILIEGGQADAARINFAFRAALSRDPSQQEASVLAGLLERQLEHYKSSPPEAVELLTYGEAPIDESIDKAALAAWTVVANVLLNLDETITKG